MHTAVIECLPAEFPAASAVPHAIGVSVFV